MSSDHSTEEPPPLGRSWKQVYVFVVVWLVIQIALLILWTQWFAR